MFHETLFIVDRLLSIGCHPLNVFHDDPGNCRGYNTKRVRILLFNLLRAFSIQRLHLGLQHPKSLMSFSWGTIRDIVWDLWRALSLFDHFS